MTRQTRLPVMITKFGNLMITARPCLLSYRPDPGVSYQNRPAQDPSRDYAKAVVAEATETTSLAVGRAVLHDV